MVLEIPNKGIVGQKDVREFPRSVNVTSKHEESTTQQDLSANTWTDVTGCSIDFELNKPADVIYLGSISAKNETDTVPPWGVGGRFHQSTAITNSTRSNKFDLHTESTSNDVYPKSSDQETTLNLQYMESLEAGSYTVKLQATGYTSGANYSARLPSGRSNIIILIIEKEE